MARRGGLFRDSRLVRKGDVFRDPTAALFDVKVIRVGRSGWVDVAVKSTTTDRAWSKRMPSGIPAHWKRISRSAGIVRNG